MVAGSLQETRESHATQPRMASKQRQPTTAKANSPSSQSREVCERHRRKYPRVPKRTIERRGPGSRGEFRAIRTGLVTHRPFFSCLSTSFWKQLCPDGCTPCCSWFLNTKPETATRRDGTPGRLESDRLELSLYNPRPLDRTHCEAGRTGVGGSQ